MFPSSSTTPINTNNHSNDDPLQIHSSQPLIPSTPPSFSSNPFDFTSPSPNGIHSLNAPNIGNIGNMNNIE